MLNENIIISQFQKSYPRCNNDSESYKNIVKNVTYYLKKYFPNTPIIFTLGNHDFFPAHKVWP